MAPADCQIPAAAAATGEHGDESLRAGTWSTAANFLCAAGRRKFRWASLASLSPNLWTTSLPDIDDGRSGRSSQTAIKQCKLVQTESAQDFLSRSAMGPCNTNWVA
ncbi:hypothetical protein PVAP13_1KG534766 [Panicum virgatum]|uniref:Uncharacterized protein n=1 Tax=Panicum virgatum TaxID=38727 RepID=A0A8T0XZ27_PANVG|nr:hypothetical protein PVAP13_1KG534766 [Panicum virgatum]